MGHILHDKGLMILLCLCMSVYKACKYVIVIQMSYSYMDVISITALVSLHDNNPKGILRHFLAHSTFSMDVIYEV